MKTLFTKNPKCDETMQHSVSNVKINNLWYFFSDRAPLKKSLEQRKISKNIVSICLWSNFFFNFRALCHPLFSLFFFLLTIMLTSTEEMLKKKSCPIYFSDTSPALEGKSMKVIKKMFYNLTFISELVFIFQRLVQTARSRNKWELGALRRRSCIFFHVRL